MPRIYLEELSLPGPVADAFASAGYDVLSGKAPGNADPGDLSLVASSEGVLSWLRHSANNPLTAVMGFAELLLRQKDLSEDVTAKLRLILEQAGRVKKSLAGREDQI